MRFRLATRSMTLNCHESEYSDNFEDFADLGGNNG